MTIQPLMPLVPLQPRNSRATSADRARFRCSFTAILPCCSAAWPAPLPLSTFTAFLGIGDFVDFYCLCRLLQPLSTFTAFVGLHCLCLILLSLSAMLTWTTDVAAC